ncbi:MAG: DIP1984 family protein [Chloroflexota bacterium]
MRLSEGLALRADTQKRIQQLGTRVAASALVQEGEAPPEDPQVLLAEMEAALVTLGNLMFRINRTNLQATLPSGMTLTQALARRDVLQQHHKLLSAIGDAAVPKQARYSRSEIRMIPTVDVADIRHRADRIAREARELDSAVQEVNWTVDLAE